MPQPMSQEALHWNLIPDMMSKVMRLLLAG